MSVDTLRLKNFGGRRQVLGVGGRGYILVDFTLKIPTRFSQENNPLQFPAEGGGK